MDACNCYKEPPIASYCPSLHEEKEMSNDWIPIDDIEIDRHTQYEVTWKTGNVAVCYGYSITKDNALAVREYRPTPYTPPEPEEAKAIRLLRSLFEAGFGSTLTSNCSGSDNRYEVISRFRKVEQMQDFYRALIACGDFVNELYGKEA